MAAQAKYDQLKHQLEQLRPLIDQYRQQAKPLLIAYRARAQRQRLYYLAPLVAAYLAYKIYRKAVGEATIDARGKVVVISGCDTGFGRGAALKLDELGYTVFAGCLQDKYVKELKGRLSSRSYTYNLDISKQQSIDAFYDFVKSKTNTIHALVNNAGVGWGGLVDWEPMDKLRLMMEINFFGHASMTKKFFEMVTTERDGRIVNLCSVAGYLATAGMSAYASSKFALEAFSDALRREVIMWDTKVSIIEPGFMKTAIIDDQDGKLQKVFNALENAKKQRYGDSFAKRMEGKGSAALIKLAEDPALVVNDIVHAISSKNPRIRYRSGWFSSKVAFPASTLPAGIVDAILGRDLSALRPAAYRG